MIHPKWPWFGRVLALRLAAVGALGLALACSSDPDPNDAGSGAGGTGTGGLDPSGMAGEPSQAQAGSGGDDNSGGEPYVWTLPAGFPHPFEPLGNPTTVEKVELGRHLFYDPRLSANNTMSCATCHQQALAFTDGRKVSLGSTGESHPRNSMTLTNVAYASTLTWANPLFRTLERQAIVPMFSEEPIELGIREARDIEAELREDPRYVELFEAAFPHAERRGTLEQMTLALGSFQRTLISSNAPFDRWIRGEEGGALSDEALEGYRLFNSEKLECFHCHVSFNLSDHVHWKDKAFFDAPYHNTGLYNVDGKGAYPEPNTGVLSVTGDPTDMGRFKAPTLRNIAVTAPYMHDGSIETLDEVLDHYSAAGRTIAEGPYVGDGSKNPYKDVLVIGFELTSDERAAVLAFLASLTDESFLRDPRFGNPW